MKGLRIRHAMAITLLIALIGCDSYTDPAPVERETVTFNGRLERGGTFVGPFPVKNSGAVRVLVNTMTGADTSVTAIGGIAVGTWDGVTCSLIVKNENATFSTVVTGTAIVGDYCVQVYDVGQFTEAVNYSVDVEHP
ncbi:MAG TPA: hypothetical protein VH702_19960 [Vicinamibacterales bacterium]|jgi:hypothetical protein